MSSEHFVGIDISKRELVVAFGGEETAAVEALPYTEGSVQALLRRLKEQQPTLIVLEASGGLERPLLEALQGAELPVVRVQPAACERLPSPKVVGRKPTGWMPAC